MLRKAILASLSTFFVLIEPAIAGAETPDDKTAWVFDDSDRMLTSDDILILILNGTIEHKQAAAWIEKRRPDLLEYVSKGPFDGCEACGGTGVIGTSPCPRCF